MVGLATASPEITLNSTTVARRSPRSPLAPRRALRPVRRLRQPLHVARRVRPATGERVAVIDFVARAGPGGLPGGRAGVALAEGVLRLGRPLDLAVGVPLRVARGRGLRDLARRGGRLRVRGRVGWRRRVALLRRRRVGRRRRVRRLRRGAGAGRVRRHGGVRPAGVALVRPRRRTVAGRVSAGRVAAALRSAEGQDRDQEQ